MAELATPPAAAPPPAAPAGTGAAATPPAAATPTPPATPPDPKAGDPPKGEAPKVGPDGKPIVVPEKYEFKLPEGFEQHDAELEAQFTPMAKELGLTNDQAQKLVDLYGGRMKALVTQQQELWNQQVATWRKEASEDPEIGGTKLEAAVKNGQRVLKQFGDESLVKYLEDSRLGDHPALLRMLNKIGAAIREDAIIMPRPGGGDGQPLAEKMYPGQPV